MFILAYVFGLCLLCGIFPTYLAIQHASSHDAQISLKHTVLANFLARNLRHSRLQCQSLSPILDPSPKPL